MVVLTVGMSEGPTYILRKKWGAEDPTIGGYEFDEEYPLEFVLVTYTNTPQCVGPSECLREVKRIQERDMTEDGLPDIKYNWLLGGDGRVYEGTGWSRAAIWRDPRQDVHAYNSITVAFIYDLKDALPKKCALDAFKLLLKDGIEKGFIKHPVSLVKLTADADQLFGVDG